MTLSKEEKMNELFEKIVAGIQLVEKEFNQEPGETKKKKAIDIINQMVDIPVIPEFLEEQVFGLVIDLVVYIFNKFGIFQSKSITQTQE